ncbi:protein ELYS isoform X2 [Latimeria chalumnae]|uniref:protein ELYS isoform X2 n=1 Tax=Latimeria chalumnae TaxID=7897 RepID=UPI00313D4F4E
MRDLVAQVTSSLLQFPDVTIQALGEDEIQLDSVLHGKFTTGRSGLAWLACGHQLEVVNSVTGARLSAYQFNGGGEECPTVQAVKEFCWLKRTGLLVALEEAKGSVLCLYDLGISRVVKAVVLPGRVTAIEPIINHGGASASTQHLNQSLRWFFGVAAVVTDVGHVLLIDLCLDDLSCSQSELDASDLEVLSRASADIPRMREMVTRAGRHLCIQLQSPTGTTATALYYVRRTNHLAVGFSDGYLQLWNMKTLKKEYHSQLERGRVPVYAFIFQEPENDPRNCCYLWAVQSSQDSEGDVVSLHLLQLAFGDRKCLASGQILYEGLEYCEERYSQDLTHGVLSLRGQSSNTRLIGCQTIEKFRNHIDGEESMNEVMSPDTSVSLFSWQVNVYGQGPPSTYLGIFDINRWYHAQMPDSLRPGEFLQNCPYFALWSLDTVVTMTSPHYLLDILVHERSLSRGVPPSYPPPEQFFNPSTYNFDATCLLNSGVVHVTCAGFQKETLHFLKKSGPCLSETIPDGYSRCLMAGLLSPRLADVQPSSLSQEEQLEAILSAAVETSSLGIITSYIKQWTSEEQPRSAANLRFVLEWAWNKVVYTKEELDRISTPLFDGSRNFIDSQMLQSLQHCQLLLSNLSTIFNCFLTEAQELTEKGLVDLTNKRMVASLISQYTQVVLWFCRCGLLPEGLDEDLLQLSRPFYNCPIIQSYYTDRRQKLERLTRGKWSSDCLMIDGMAAKIGDRVEKLWSRDEGGTGRYPPPSLHALLDLYLLENVDETLKHAIVIYLLLDLTSSSSSKTESSIESFPTAFAIPLSLLKLIQGFWLLDHNDYENSLDLILHPATSQSMQSWQHSRIIQALMCQGEHKQALRYIQMMKPVMSSNSEVKLYLTVLLYNRCMIEAWNLLRQHMSLLNAEELLKHMYEVCQEMELMEDLLKLPFTITEQECLEKFLQNSSGIQNHEFLLVHHLQRANYVPALQLNQSLKMNLMNDRDPRIRERTIARNSILDQYGKVLPRVQRRLAMERAKPYQHPLTILREVSRPKPLSTVAKPAVSGSVITRATFINDVLSKIGEVWTVSEKKADLSLYSSPKSEEPSPIPLPVLATELPDAFVGTPITKSSRRISRLMDSVVRPIQLSAVESPQLSPVKGVLSWLKRSPQQSSSLRSGFLKCIKKASELSLLQTPPVVKRARALTSNTDFGSSEFTPHSILRSSLRPTPLASPSASPGRSVTPPLRAKDTKISFLEENTTTKWRNEDVARETNFLSATSSILKSRLPSVAAWSSFSTTTTTATEKVISFALGKPSEDQPEMVDSQGGAGRLSTEEIEVSKEASNVSARSEQSTLEYHDAPTPEDMEDDIVVIMSKPADNELNRPAIIEEQEVFFKKKDEEQPWQSKCEEASQYLEHKELKGVDSEDLAIQKHEISAEEYLDTFQETVKANSEAPVIEGEIISQEGHPSVILLAEETTLKLPSVVSESIDVDSESVFSVHDSEDVVSTHSENKSEEGEYTATNKDHDDEVKILEDVCLQEDVLVLPLKSQETQECEDRILEVKAYEDEPVPVVYEEEPIPRLFTELHSASHVVVRYDFEDVGQQSSTNLVHSGEHAVCEIAEVDGEQDGIPGNFTLILEGDGEEEEVIDLNNPIPVLVVPETENIEVAQEHYAVNEAENQKCTQKSLFVLTNVQEPLRDPQDIAEALPYVSEPIKVSIAENLLEAIKDTRSKEFAAELVEPTVQEDLLVTEHKLISITHKTAKSQAPANIKDMDSSQVEVVQTLSTRAQGTSARDGDEHRSSFLQMELKEAKENKQEITVLSTPRRGTRHTKSLFFEIPETAHLILEESPDSLKEMQILATPTRGTKTTKESNTETSSPHLAAAEETEMPVAPRRSSRRAMNVTLELPENALPVLEETLTGHKKNRMPTTPRRSSRRACATSGSAQPGADQRVDMPATPTRSSRQAKAIKERLENGPLKEEKPLGPDQQRPMTPRRGARRGRSSVLNIVESTQPVSAEVPPNQPELRLHATPARRTRAAAENSQIENIIPVPEENTINQMELQRPVTPRRSTRRATSSKSETDRHERPVPQDTISLQKGEEVVRSRTTGRRTAKTSTSDDQATKSWLPSVPEVKREESVIPAASEDMSRLKGVEEVLNDKGEPFSIIVTRKPPRNRNLEALLPEHLPFPEKQQYVFSPPITRTAKKSKAEKSTISLEPDLSSQFVFSPPATRFRLKLKSEASTSQDVPITEGAVPKEKKLVDEQETNKTTRSKTTKQRSRKKKSSEKERSGSPPPIEINLISPFASPLEETVQVSEKMNLRKNRKRLMGPFPKPVTRRKI